MSYTNETTCSFSNSSPGSVGGAMHLAGDSSTWDKSESESDFVPMSDLIWKEVLLNKSQTASSKNGAVNVGQDVLSLKECLSMQGTLLVIVHSMYPFGCGESGLDFSLFGCGERPFWPCGRSLILWVFWTGAKAFRAGEEYMLKLRGCHGFLS